MNAPAGLVFPFPDPPQEGDALEVAPGILWARLPLPMALDHVNIYALDDGDSWTVFDTGLDTARIRGAWGKLLAGPLRGKRVGRVIVSHHHPDHIGLAGWFQRDGAELLTTRTAWLFARMLQLDAQDRPAPETLAFWRSAGMGAAELERRAALRPFNFADCVAPMPLGFTRLVEGQTLHAGGRDWIVRLGQGHAPDQITLWSRDDTLVLGADQLLPGISPNLGVYATEPGADPVAEWLASCDALATHACPKQLVLPGHKLPYRGLPLRLRQMAENHHSALARLRAYLHMPRSAAECFGALFRRDIGESELTLALVEAVAHLNHLHARGETRVTCDDFGVQRYSIRGDSTTRIG
jgi:glyoxylase-like metal-dependent hydrolase (beta-lactamase superfamily II)